MVSVFIPTSIISLTCITYLCIQHDYTSCDPPHAWVIGGGGYYVYGVNIIGALVNKSFRPANKCYDWHFVTQN